MEKPKDITHLIERLDVFEQTLEVQLEALSAWIQPDRSVDRDYGLSVRGELHARNGTTLKQSTKIVVDVYDGPGRVVATNNYCWRSDFDPRSFFAFQTFAVDLGVPLVTIKQIRVYPKPSS